MLSRGLRKLAQPIKRFASVELKEVAAEGGFNYDVVLVATWTGILVNHYCRGLDGSHAVGVPILYPFKQSSTDFDYGSIKKINNLFGQFQPPPPFSY